MSEEPALFDLARVRRPRKGDRVLVRTMWGEELCIVTDVHTEDDFPMVRVRTTSGDDVSVSVARVKSAEE